MSFIHSFIHSFKNNYLCPGVIDFVQAISQLACCISQLFSLLPEQTEQGNNDARLKGKKEKKKKRKERRGEEIIEGKSDNCHVGQVIGIDSRCRIEHTRVKFSTYVLYPDTSSR